MIYITLRKAKVYFHFSGKKVNLGVFCLFVEVVVKHCHNSALDDCPWEFGESNVLHSPPFALNHKMEY